MIHGVPPILMDILQVIRIPKNTLAIFLQILLYRFFSGCVRKKNLQQGGPFNKIKTGGGRNLAPLNIPCESGHQKT